MLSLFLLFAPTPAPTSVHGRAGQSVSLSVHLPAPSTGILVNREAPNRLTLHTPWGNVQARPSGQGFPSLQTEFADYYGRLDAVRFQVAVPGGTRPGVYNSHLALQLFICNKRALICTQKNLTYPVSIRVGNVQKAATLKVNVSEFQRGFRF